MLIGAFSWIKMLTYEQVLILIDIMNNVMVLTWPGVTGPDQVTLYK